MNLAILPPSSLQNIPSDGSPLRNKDIRVFSKSAMEHIGGVYILIFVTRDWHF